MDELLFMSGDYISSYINGYDSLKPFYLHKQCSRLRKTNRALGYIKSESLAVMTATLIPDLLTLFIKLITENYYTPRCSNRNPKYRNLQD